MIDIIVIGVLLLGVFIGAWTGFVKMLFSFFASLVAMILSTLFSPHVFLILKEYTPWKQKLTEIIEKNINLEQLAKQLGDSATVTDSSVLSPQILKALTEKMGRENILGEIQTQISQNLAEVALQILAYFLTFLLALLVLAVVARFIYAVTRLPLINEINRFSGAVVGGGISLLLLWTIFFVLNFWFSTGRQMELLSMIEESTVAKYLYHYNFFILFLKQRI